MNPVLLLAEGDAVLRNLYARFLTVSGYEVVQATDGPDCAHKLLDLNPRLLVLDLELSLGGASVLACLREQPPATWVPVVLLATADFRRLRAIEPEQAVPTAAHWFARVSPAFFQGLPHVSVLHP